jgi:hypothetical protein
MPRILAVSFVVKASRGRPPRVRDTFAFITRHHVTPRGLVSGVYSAAFIPHDPAPKLTSTPVESDA